MVPVVPQVPHVPHAPHAICYMSVTPHLILLPGPEEVDRPVLSPLDDCPASLTATLLAPGLQQAVGALRSEQVDAAGGLTRVQHVLTVSPRACGQCTYNVGTQKP